MPIPRSRPSPPPRPAQPDEHYELLRWVAELYYLQQQGQADIASLIGASVSKVSRLLAEARRQGIVTIHVAASRVGESPFERELAERLGLQAVYVAPARVADASVASRAAALMAARMLPRLLPMQGLIGFSGGYTVAQLAHSLEPMPGVDLTIVPLQGNWVEGGLHVHNDQVCRDAAHSLQARALSLPAPMVFDRADTRDALLRDRSIRPVTSRWSELDVAVVGVGPAPSVEGVDYLSVMGQLPDEVRSDLQHHGVVGDLCAHMFDADGPLRGARGEPADAVDLDRRAAAGAAGGRRGGRTQQGHQLAGRGAHRHSEGVDHRSAGRREPVGAGQRREQ